MPSKLAVLLLFTFVYSLAGFNNPEANATSLFMMPQPKNTRGPWFEGWYIRVTDPTQNRSFATITTSSTHERIRLRGDSILPGYIAFIYSNNQDVGTHSVEYFPDRTWATSQGQAGEPDSHFTWRGEGFGELNDKDLYLNLPSGDEISVSFGERAPWSIESSDWGPEGWIGLAGFLPLRWYVDSLGTPVEYRVKLAATGETISGQGFAHIEKNWGNVFPTAWMWTQATSPDNTAHLALAGGPLSLGPVTLTSYLVGYKTKDLDIEIRPDQYLTSTFKTNIDACNGLFELNASNSIYRLKIRAKAERASFASVSIPTYRGFEKDRGIESFQATVTVYAYKNDQLLEKRIFAGAALEFGADNMLCAPPQK